MVNIVARGLTKTNWHIYSKAAETLFLKTSPQKHYTIFKT
jgi:hypothetical protein